MSLVIENLPEAIRSSKASLRKALPNYSEVFHEVETEMRRKVAQIVKEREAGEAVIPIVQYAEIADAASQPAQQRRQHDSVGVVNRAGRERRTRLAHLVAGR